MTGKKLCYDEVSHFGETPEEVLDLRFEDAGFEILFNATGNDNRAGREAEMWVNAIARKNGIY